MYDVFVFVFSNVLRDGFILSIFASGLILLTVRLNPRLWLQDYPKDIQTQVSPKTAQEKKQSLFFGIPFLALLFLVPLIFCIWLKHHSTTNVSFLSLFLNAFGVAFFFNLIDLVVIDWLIFCFVTPRFMVIPGTEGMAGYKDYGFHFKAFLVGTILSVVMGAIISVIVYLWA
jgi:hypothetical protein